MDRIQLDVLLVCEDSQDPRIPKLEPPGAWASSLGYNCSWHLANLECCIQQVLLCVACSKTIETRFVQFLENTDVLELTTDLFPRSPATSVLPLFTAYS